MIGTRLLHYEIVEKLGEGGMGVVYKARDTHLDRFVAIKVLPPGKVRDPERHARFVQEAKAASALNHPNIIHIYDIGEQDGLEFIAMEHVDGRTLDQFIPRHGMRLNDALKIAVQIADALARAHGAGIVHRDLKPSNVMVDSHGVVKLLDFGLAKLAGAAPTGEDERTRTLQPRTEAGAIMGTASYMSPEQVQGRPVGAQSDVFSFGIVLYEMVTGARPFGGGSPAEIASAILRDPVAEPQGLPREVWRVLERCLRKDPGRRPQSLSDLKLELEDLVHDSGSGMLGQPSTVRIPRARLRWWMAAALAAALGVSGWLARRGGQPATPPVLSVAPLTTDPGAERSPAFSPDGNQVVYVGEHDGQADLYVKAVGTNARLRLTSAAGEERYPRWSPDGRFIAFSRSGNGPEAGIRVVSPLGGPERRIRLEPEIRGLDWSADGNWLVVASAGTDGRRSRLFALRLDNGEERELYSGELDTETLILPAVSPDGRQVAFYWIKPQTRSELRVLPIDEQMKPAGAARALELPAGATPQIELAVGGPVLTAWSADSRSVFCSFGPNALSVRIYRIPTGGGEPSALNLPGEVTLSPAVSLRGERMAFVRISQDENIYRLPLRGEGIAGGAPAPFAPSTVRDSNPYIGPDGKLVAFASYRSGNPEIYTADPTGRNVVQLTALKSIIAGSPRISPDGQWIVFDARKDQSDVMVMPVTGGPMRNLTNHGAADIVPTWSRDGKHIYFSSTRSGAYQVWKMRSDGTDPRAITKTGGFISYESWDAKRLYYTKTNAAATSLWTTGVEGGAEEKVFETLYRHNFRVCEKGIYFSTVDGPEGGPAVCYYRFRDGKILTVHRMAQPVALGLSVAPDESWMLFSQLDTAAYDIMLVENFR